MTGTAPFNPPAMPMNRLRQENTMNSRTRHPRGTMRAITQLGYGGSEVLSLAMEWWGQRPTQTR